MKQNPPIRIESCLKPQPILGAAAPFLSIFFILLLFFMLGSSFVQVSGIAVNLPKTAARMHSSQKIVATVSADNRIFFNDVEIRDIKDFRNQLSSLNIGAQKTLLLRVDTSADFGPVAKLMAAAEDLNFNVILPTAAEPLTTPALGPKD